MKIKKLFIPILLAVMLLPIVVIAETCDTNSIKIESIEVKGTNGNAKEINPASISETTINLNLQMIEVEDKIEYKVLIKNNSNEDFEISESNISSNSNYFEYKVNSEDNSNIVPANSQRTMYVSAKYKSEVPDSEYQEGKYNDKKEMIINLSNDSTNNPFTDDLVLLYLLGFYLCLLVFVILYRNNKKVIVPITIALLALPLSVKALCKSEIIIISNILIDKPVLSSFKIDCSTEEFKYYEGMTFKDWIKSKLYTGNISGEFTSLKECEDVFGSDKGCALKRTKQVYSYPIKDIYYTVYTEDCRRNKCEEVYNTIYRIDFAESEFDILDDCEYSYGTGTCTKINDKYYHIDSYHLGSEEECNEELNKFDDYPYKACSPVPFGYKVTYETFEDDETMEECEQRVAGYNDYHNKNSSCFPRTIEYYSPIEKEGKMLNNFAVNFYEDSFAIYRGSYFSMFWYDEQIENMTYLCEKGGECVSPESDISSSNGITIKAKNIKVNDKVTYYDFNTNKVEIGTVTKVYIHKDASNLIRYTLSDNTYLEVTDYHPIYTKDGWKSYTGRNGYQKPKVGDLVKTNTGYKMIKSITPFRGKEDYYDFQIKGKDGKSVKNYFANGILVEGSY